MARPWVAMLIGEHYRGQTGLSARLSVSEDVRTACQCDAAQMAMFTALESEYLLQSAGLADPTVTANGAVGKTNSCNERVSVK